MVSILSVSPAHSVRHQWYRIMPNPFDVVMFVLLAIGALQQMGWLPW
ncbi:TPA: hypothetical protein ACPZW1_003374 [Enterobacter hormaechei subsp. hoffmannii]|nr:hypothetical protein [Enterobacter hormaechei]MCU2655679.1 hypothetical protein [Enterobacter hormaechei subsp. hoffmannii]EHF4930295.1 hypothetical protein [Enterobacter hormaechei]EKW1333501.1 hypothetical protein [Enterobacter hormaechei]MCU2913155.1 hypothetical protein [Enterobacter hormaechei subsp. hoffmannii]MCU2962372.1 hypothetical protein [Enterobacter hormaechei subsp. hoffmannii]